MKYVSVINLCLWLVFIILSINLVKQKIFLLRTYKILILENNTRCDDDQEEVAFAGCHSHRCRVNLSFGSRCDYVVAVAEGGPRTYFAYW